MRHERRLPVSNKTAASALALFYTLPKTERGLYCTLLCYLLSYAHRSALAISVTSSSDSTKPPSSLQLLPDDVRAVARAFLASRTPWSSSRPAEQTMTRLLGPMVCSSSSCWSLCCSGVCFDGGLWAST